MDLIVRVGDRDERVSIENSRDRIVVRLGDRAYEVRECRLGNGRSSLLMGGEQYEVAVSAVGEGAYEVGSRLGNERVEVFDPLSFLAREGAGKSDRRRVDRVTAYMPGRVVALLVSEGEEVVVGQGLVVLEAMKMENEIQAEHDGVVTRIAVTAGQAVEGGDLLFELR